MIRLSTADVEVIVKVNTRLRLSNTVMLNTVSHTVCINACQHVVLNACNNILISIG